MRILLKAALIAIALVALQSPVPTMADGKEEAGAPIELIGRWGSNKEQCQSWHRKIDNVTIIDKNFLTSCGGTGCEAAIVSHKKTVDGYIGRKL